MFDSTLNILAKKGRENEIAFAHPMNS